MASRQARPSDTVGGGPRRGNPATWPDTGRSSPCLLISNLWREGPLRKYVHFAGCRPARLRTRGPSPYQAGRSLVDLPRACEDASTPFWSTWNSYPDANAGQPW